MHKFKAFRDLSSNCHSMSPVGSLLRPGRSIFGWFKKGPELSADGYAGGQITQSSLPVPSESDNMFQLFLSIGAASFLPNRIDADNLKQCSMCDYISVDAASMFHDMFFYHLAKRWGGRLQNIVGHNGACTVWADLLPRWLVADRHGR